MNRLVSYLFVAAAAGAIGWVLCDKLRPTRAHSQHEYPTEISVVRSVGHGLMPEQVERYKVLYVVTPDGRIPCAEPSGSARHTFNFVSGGRPLTLTTELVP